MKKTVPGIYRFLNLVNKKSYVGSTVNLSNRKSLHLKLLRSNSSHSSKLQNAWNKYGDSNFAFEILEICPVDKLEERENYWIHAFDAVKNGYNCSEDSKVPTRGFKHSEETRKKMSEAQKKLASTEKRKKLSASILITYNKSKKGVPKTQEHRDKIGKARKGKLHSEETKEKMRGRVMSQDARDKLSARVITTETRKKISEANKGRCMGINHPNSKPVAQYTTGGELIASFSSTAEASRSTGIKRESIKEALHGRIKLAKGFVWRFLDVSVE